MQKENCRAVCTLSYHWYRRQGGYGGEDQVVEHLLSKYEALSSNPRTT
jgi:hypothetical protein